MKPWWWTATTTATTTTTNNDIYYASIEEALNAAEPFDTIILHEGIYTKPISIEKEGIILRAHGTGNDINGCSFDRVELHQMEPATPMLTIRAACVIASHLYITSKCDRTTLSSKQKVSSLDRKSVV